MPYWDYTIDMTAFEESGDLSSFFNSQVFGEDFFGSAVTHLVSGSDDGVEGGTVDPSGRILSGRFTQVCVVYPSPCFYKTRANRCVSLL